MIVAVCLSSEARRGIAPSVGGASVCATGGEGEGAKCGPGAARPTDGELLEQQHYEPSGGHVERGVAAWYCSPSPSSLSLLAPSFLSPPLSHHIAILKYILMVFSGFLGFLSHSDQHADGFDAPEFAEGDGAASRLDSSGPPGCHPGCRFHCHPSPGFFHISTFPHPFLFFISHIFLHYPYDGKCGRLKFVVQ